MCPPYLRDDKLYRVVVMDKKGLITLRYTHDMPRMLRLVNDDDKLPITQATIYLQRDIPQITEDHINYLVENEFLRGDGRNVYLRDVNELADSMKTQGLEMAVSG